MRLRNFKLSVILNSKRIVVYSQAENWDDAKRLISEKLEVSESNIRGAKLSTVEMERIKTKHFKPNFSVDKNAKLMPLNARIFHSKEEQEQEKAQREERKKREIIAKSHALSGTDWVLKGNQKSITDYYWMVRNEIVYHKLQDYKMRNGFTLLEFLDAFIAGFEQPKLSVTDEDVTYKVKTIDGEHEVVAKKIISAGERSALPLALHYKSTI